MKHLESFNHRHKGESDFLKSIWMIDEEEIFDAFSDLFDNFNVKIGVVFLLKSPKGKEFSLFSSFDQKISKEGYEKIEAYSAAGFDPVIKIHIEKDGSVDMRKVQSMAMECIFQMEDYKLDEVNRGSESLSLKFIFDDGNNSKSLYHEKGNAFFESKLTEFKKAGYDIIIGKFFKSTDSSYLKFRSGTRKLYSISFEKKYPSNITTIDNLHNDKKIFENALSNILKEFGNKAYPYTETNSFRIKPMGDREIYVSFVMNIYERY